MATKYKIKVIAENTINISIVTKDYQLTGAETLYMTVKPDYDQNQDDSSAVIEKTIQATPGNQIDFTLTASDMAIAPAKYVYDVKLAMPNGQTTLVYGEFIVQEAVTLRGA